MCCHSSFAFDKGTWRGERRLEWKLGCLDSANGYGFWEVTITVWLLHLYRKFTVLSLPNSQSVGLQEQIPVRRIHRCIPGPTWQEGSRRCSRERKEFSLWGESRGHGLHHVLGPTREPGGACGHTHLDPGVLISLSYPHDLAHPPVEMTFVSILSWTQMTIF
jgi:hypothetical protein